MPVATQAALKYTDLDDAKGLDYQVLLANTYHLLIRPGPEVAPFGSNRFWWLPGLFP
jgi:queuine tRNA-ribosyltransferase